MANVTPRKDKDGNIISYQIRVFRGRDASRRRLKDYILTWRPEPGMTKRQIEKELARQATLFEENCKLGNVSIDRYTFQDYSDYALETKIRGGMKAKTASSYRDLLTRINAEIGPLKLQDIRPDHLNRYYAKLAEPGQNKLTGGPLSPKTIREHHRVISSILSLAVKEGLIPTNAAQRATPPKVPKHEMDVFEADQLQAILQALEGEPMKWRIVTTLLIATGARRGEIMGLRWENVDWENKRLYLCENRVYTKASGTISTTLKTGESRYVSVPASVLELLNVWKAEQAAGCNMLGIEPPAYIATHENGKLIHPDGITDWLTKFSKRHGLPHIHPHAFRHTMASLLISEGVDVVTVSKRLGHAQTSTTLNVYSHVLAKSDERASDTLDDLIFKPSKPQSEPQSR